MADRIRWAVIGTGGIADRFCAEVPLGGAPDGPGAEVVAVASRRPGGARELAGRHRIAHRFEGPDSVQQVVHSPEVDAVYVASPHPFHAEQGLAAIAAGKHVLIEKPLAMNAAQASALMDAATQAGVFCMEAMWTRFLPHMVRLRELLAEAAVGQIQVVHADQGMRFDPDPQHRLFAPALGGGALLDLGVYPFSFASMVLGSPQSVTAASTPAMTGVDLSTSAVLSYAIGAQAVLTCTAAAATPMRAFIAGTLGRIEIEPRWYSNSGLTLIRQDGRTEVFPAADGVTGPGVKGMRFEIAEAGRCIGSGRTQSLVMPLAESVSILATLDEVRAQAAAAGGGSPAAAVDGAGT
jgi:predicted dehydrogenase